MFKRTNEVESEATVSENRKTIMKPQAVCRSTEKQTTGPMETKVEKGS
jgi:hypothetical protein